MNQVNIVHPIEYREIQPDESLIFLSGPIRGASNWREMAINILRANLSGEKIVFATPDRLGEQKIFTPGKEGAFDRQRQWELFYLRKAIEQGVVLFWLDAQKTPLKEDGWIQQKSYGAITHLELGQIMVTHRDRMVVWIDMNYKERSTIVNDLKQSNYLDLSIPFDPKKLSDFSVEETLEETCARAIVLLKKLHA